MTAFNVPSRRIHAKITERIGFGMARVVLDSRRAGIAVAEGHRLRTSRGTVPARTSSFIII
jgi:hypothetical protein